MRLLIVSVAWLAVETGDALGHTRNSDLARGLDPFLIQLGGSHFGLHVASLS